MRSPIHPIATALLCGAMFLFAPLEGSAQPAPQVSCGLGPPPGSPGFAELEQLQEQQRAALGYSLVCDENLRRYDHVAAAQPLPLVMARLAFQPVALENTPFREFEMVGGVPDLPAEAGASALHRIFRTAAGQVIDLREWDLSVLSAEVFSKRELQTQQVNGAPAQLLVVQAPSGRAVSLLAWVEGRRRYELSIDTNVVAAPPSPTLQALAASLPKSVAAKGGAGDNCALPGDQVQWIADYCMASMETDDEMAAVPCIMEEGRTHFESACGAKQHYKRELCKLLIDGGSVRGPLERCVSDAAFRGRTVERAGVGGALR